MRAEREAEQRRDRAQRDVALVPGHLEPEHAPAVVLAPADDAVVGDRGRVGAGVGIREREARDLEALREPRQVVALLLVGAVVQQELARSQRVRDQHRDRDRAGARRQLRHDLRVRVRREAQTAVLLRDDHPEETLVLDVLPHRRRHVLVDVRGLPVGDHRAQLVDLAVEEALLLVGELRGGQRQELLPVGLAGEELAVPPDRPGLDRLALGLRHRRHHLAEAGEERVADERTAQARDEQGDPEEHRGRRQPEVEPRRQEPRRPRGAEERRDGCGPGGAARPHVGEREQRGEEEEDPKGRQHRGLLHSMTGGSRVIAAPGCRARRRSRASPRRGRAAAP